LESRSKDKTWLHVVDADIENQKKNNISSYPIRLNNQVSVFNEWDSLSDENYSLNIQDEVLPLEDMHALEEKKCDKSNHSDSSDQSDQSEKSIDDDILVIRRNDQDILDEIARRGPDAELVKFHKFKFNSSYSQSKAPSLEEILSACIDNQVLRVNINQSQMHSVSPNDSSISLQDADFYLGKYLKIDHKILYMLSITNCKFYPESDKVNIIVNLCWALRTRNEETEIEMLDLSGNNFSTEEVQEICSKLSHINLIYFGDNGFTDLSQIENNNESSPTSHNREPLANLIL